MYLKDGRPHKISDTVLNTKHWSSNKLITYTYWSVSGCFPAYCIHTQIWVTVVSYGPSDFQENVCDLQ